MEKVILTEDVEGLGKAGDVVRVKGGYARNYLFPRKLAIPADEKKIKQLEHAKKLIEDKKRRKEKIAKDLKGVIEELSITIKRKAGQDDKLFGAVTADDIQKALERENIKISKKDVEMDEPIKKLGFYTVKIRLAPQVTASLKVWVVQE